MVCLIILINKLHFLTLLEIIDRVNFMRICFLAAANSIHSHRWVNYFVEAGYDVTWVSLVPSIYEIPKKVRYFEVATNGSLTGILGAIFKTRNIISKLNPDILHVHYVGSYGLLGLFSGASSIVATPWGSDVIEGKNSFFKRKFITKILRRAKLVTCDAYHMQDEVLELGVSEDCIRIINFGIDSKRFSKQLRDTEIRKEFGLADEPTIISLRNFEPVYDIESLVRAVPKVLDTIPNAKFILIGKGSLESELKSLATQLKINNAVKFVGFVANEKLPQVLCSMDVYVSTSLSDAGIAASTAEAMACEVPVVISNSGENDRWIDDGENGFLVPVTQPEILADRLIELLEDSELRFKVGCEGRKVIMKNNDYGVEMAKMDELYKDIGKSQ